MKDIISSTDFHDFFINYISEIIAFLTTPIIYAIYRYVRNFAFKRVMGKDIVRDYKLIYARFKLMKLQNSKGEEEHFPYVKSSGDIRVSMNDPVSFCETRSINYLVRIISKQTKYAPDIVSDEDFKDKTNISFCSLGGANFKSIDVINSKKNKFYNFSEDNLSIIDKTNQQSFKIDNHYDYAIVLKIKSDIHPKRSHLCIAGIGEWGTSGASYYLSHYWAKIFIKSLFYSNYGALIRVKQKSDDSGELIGFRKSN